MKRTILSALVLPLILLDCAGAIPAASTKTDIIRVESQDVVGNSSGLAEKTKAFEQANKYCRDRGREMQLVASSETESGYGKRASGEVYFKCVTPGAPSAQQP